MRIVVYGAGSVGGYLAARLAKAGRAVAVVARGAHLVAIRERGLTLETPDETFTVTVEASDDPAALGPADLVLVTAKTTANAAVAAGIGPLLKPGTPVVFAQNGVFWWYGAGFDPGVPVETGRLDPGGRLAAAIGMERAMGLVVYSPNEVTAPGVVANGARANRFVLGAPRAEAALDGVAAALGDAGFALETTPDIRRAMWQKLLVNLSSAPIAALTGSTAAEVVDDPLTRLVCRRLMEEGMRVAAAHGFSDLGIDVEARTRPGSRPAHKPSMLQDVERRRPAEIDSMIRIVQDFAEAAGIATPTLEVATALLARLGRNLGIYPPPA